MLINSIAEGKPLPTAYRNLLFADNFQHRGGRLSQECFSSGHEAIELQAVSCFEQGSQPSWMNHLFFGENGCILSWLCNADWRKKLQRYGGIRLAYIDPPFTVGTDFSMSMTVSFAASRSNQPASILRQKAYSDIWGQGNGAFWAMMRRCFLGIHDLLSEDGSLYVHCDWRTVAHMRLLLDAIFGPERFLDEIIWHYTGGGRSKRYFSRKHDTILHYTKTDKWIFNPDAVRVPYKPTSGYAKGGIMSAAGKRYLPHPQGTPVDDVWDIPIINPLAKERTGYPTQKPLALLERIIAASSNPGDIIADFFCGSGTTLLAAQRLGRRWIGVDKGPLAIATCRKRLLNSQRREPFSVWYSKVDAENGKYASPCPWIMPAEKRTYSVSGVCQSNPLGGIRVELAHVDMTWPADVANIPTETPDSHTSAAHAHAGLRDDSQIADWKPFIAFWAVGTLCYVAAVEQKTFVPLWESEPDAGVFETPLLSDPQDTVFWIQVTDIFGRIHWGKVG